MDIRHLRAFITVAEHGTVSSAADVLRITQPALSRQITRLEQEFSLKLFARSGRRLLITALGEELLAECRNLLAQVSLLTDQARALRGGDMRVLRVAGSALTVEGLFPTFLRRWAAHVPAVRIALIEADPDKQLDMLERGDAHLAINPVNAIPVDDRRFAFFLLPPFCVLAVHPPGLQVGGGDIDISRLCQYPLLLPNASYATRSIFDAGCRVAGVRPNVMVESGAAHALLAMAQEGHGVAVIPSILRPSGTLLRSSRVTHRRAPLNIELAVLWDRRRALSRNAETFNRLLYDHVERTFSHDGRRRPRSRTRRVQSESLMPWT